MHTMGDKLIGWKFWYCYFIKYSCYPVVVTFDIIRSLDSHIAFRTGLLWGTLYKENSIPTLST
jgi:hypothetical protein